MKSKRRRRYKKKKYDLFLISKIALICYLAIFGVGYMTSNTSAYFTSQSEVSELITAGIWEIPEDLVNGCVEEITIDDISDEEIIVDSEAEADIPMEESEKDGIPSGENKIDCGGEENAIEIVEGENDCKKEDGSLVVENEKDTALSKEVKADCKEKVNKANEENKTEIKLEDVKTIEPIIEQKSEIENAENVTEKEEKDKVNVDDTKVDDPQKSEYKSPTEPDIKDESVKESKNKSLAEKDSTKEEPSETDETDTVK